MKPTLAEVAATTNRHLDAIAQLWKPHVKLTLLVRNPESGPDRDADAVFTNDDLPSAIEALKLRHLRAQETSA